ncbi:MAG: SseB family protein [Gammaproteobacteria bacterium]
MTPDDETPPNRLEQLLNSYAEDPQWYSDFFIALATEHVTVAVSPPWEEVDVPPPVGRKLLIVSDGSNQEQPMLALFSRPARAEKFCRENVQDGQFAPFETASSWALLQVPEGAGIRLNPNEPQGFRIPPPLMDKLKHDVRQALHRAQAKAREAQ